MRHVILMLALAGCTQGPNLPGPQKLQLADELVIEQPTEGCWHQTNLGYFEMPCEGPDTAALQRALAARDLFDGKIDGQMNAATRSAIKAYQEPLGLGSAYLSLAAARSLGLVAVPM